MKTHIFVALLSSAFFCNALQVQAEIVNPFEGTHGYNAIIFNNMTQNGSNDVEGQLAVGNNMTTNGSFGVNLVAGSNSAPAALYVGGHLHTSANGWETHGNVYFGSGTTDKPGGNQWYTPPVVYIKNGTGSELQTNPLDFAAMENNLRANAAKLASLEDTGVTTSFTGNESWISCANGGQQVVNIDLNQLYNGGNDLSNLKLSGQSDTMLLINLIGGGDTILNMFGGFELLGGLTADHVLINFVDVATVNISSMSVKANLLGVDTDLVVANGNIEGITVFNNAIFNGGGEVHSKNFFDGGFDIPDTNTSSLDETSNTPEPATLLVLGLSLLGAPLYMRKRAVKV